MATNITIAKLNTMVTANAVQFVTEFNKAENVAKRTAGTVRNVLGSLGVGLSVAGVAMFGKSVIDLGGRIVDLSTQAGMTGQSFQVMSNLAAQSGVSMEMVAKAAEVMRSKIQEAAEGSESANKSLRALNLTAAGLQALRPEQQWEVIARRIATATDKQAALNAASDIFGGKIGPKLKEVLERLATDGYEKVASSLKDLNLTDAQLASLDKAGDKLSYIATQLKVIAAQKFLEIMDYKPKGGSGATFWDSIERVLTGKVPAHLLEKAGAMGGGPVGAGSGSAGWRDAERRSMEAYDLEEQMRKARDADPWSRLRDENSRDKQVNSLLDEFFGSLDEKSKSRKISQIDTKIPDINSDRLSRIGLLTGEGAKDELKRQTGFLQALVNEAKRTNSLLLKQNPAVYA